MNPIPVKDRIRCATCRPFLVHFSSGRVVAYRIRPSDASAWMRMTPKRGTCWGVCFCALPIRDKSLINTCLLNPILDKDLIPYSNSLYITNHFWCTSVGAYGIRPPNASAWRRMTPKSDTCWGVCFCAPTHTDQKLDSHLLNESQTRWVLGCMSLRPTPPRRETLKICMDARKTRRGLDENGHIHRKPGEDWMKMAISAENPARIG